MIWNNASRRASAQDDMAATLMHRCETKAPERADGFLA
jgi:hypothetical protein